MESLYRQIIKTIIAVGLCLTACVPVKNKPYCLSQGDKALLLTGDIIMRRGNGMLSTMIVKYMDDTLNISHCGIIIRDGDSINVIHCLSSEVSPINGAQQCSLDEFTSEGVPGSIFAVRCLKDTIGCLADGARYYLKINKSFDRSFDMNDTTELFCSEMPLRILKDRLDLDLVSEDTKFTFSCFFNPEHFKVLFKYK